MSFGRELVDLSVTFCSQVASSHSGKSFKLDESAVLKDIAKVVSRGKFLVEWQELHWLSTKK